MNVDISIITVGFITTILGVVSLSEKRRLNNEVDFLTEATIGLQTKLDSAKLDIDASQKMEDWALHDLDNCMSELSRIRADASRELSKIMPPWESTK